MTRTESVLSIWWPGQRGSVWWWTTCRWTSIGETGQVAVRFRRRALGGPEKLMVPRGDGGRRDVV